MSEAATRRTGKVLPVPSLIIFDCDGVVADSETLANALLAESISEIGTPTTIEDSIRLFMGKRWQDTLAAIEAWTGAPVPADFEARHRARARGRMRAEVRAIAGLTAFIAAHSGTARCIASSSSHEWLAHCVDAFALRSHFGANLFSATEVARGKPAPDIFLHAAARMGHSATQCLVIEDSVSGVLGARAAGMSVIGFLGGSHIRHGHGEQLLEAGAHHLAADYAEVARLIALAE
ncbi:MAG: HAD-IA family hydrolase [Hyphomicrobiaceae bacterium]